MASYNFNKDLPLGEKGEMVLKEHFQNKYNANYLGKSSTEEQRYWDIKLHFPSKDTTNTYEVKTDVFSDTGNLFVEYTSRGKDTGIRITKADWWANIYWHLGEVWFIKVDNLRQLIEDNNFRMTVNSGDEGSGTGGYLIPRHSFRKHFIVEKIKIPT